ncbi:unnamed protein product [Ceratitis capitata]|uniref:(Mediterranean fruit fly) hypothetical protein n=1 Tax=Ceratitis capitata TaxID=7213 RepID=A0A811UKJ5_CERCA|nr:unnamed protein product [Ceratitis capitata]
MIETVKEFIERRRSKCECDICKRVTIKNLQYSQLSRAVNIDSVWRAEARVSGMMATTKITNLNYFYFNEYYFMGFYFVIVSASGESICDVDLFSFLLRK